MLQVFTSSANKFVKGSSKTSHSFSVSLLTVMGRERDESAFCGLVYGIKVPELILQETVTSVGKSGRTVAFSWMVVCF